LVERITKESVDLLNNFTSGSSVKKEMVWMRLRVLKNVLSSIGLLMPHSSQSSSNNNNEDSEGLSPLKSQKISVGIEAHPSLTSIRSSIGTTLYIVGSFLSSHRQDDIKTAKLLASGILAYLKPLSGNSKRDQKRQMQKMLKLKFKKHTPPFKHELRPFQIDSIYIHYLNRLYFATGGYDIDEIDSKLISYLNDLSISPYEALRK